MGKGKGPWQDGRRAWERLNGWHQDGPRAAPGHPDDGDGALDALADVGFVRHLLDQAELVAVRTARRHGKSWAEIAVKLGVTRQSAWERWRDLDDAPDSAPIDTGPADSETGQRPTGVVARAARELRRQSSIRVPNVIGLSWNDARQVLQECRLVAMATDPDGPPTGWSHEVVTDQSPESGARVPAGSAVRLWAHRGGGLGGVREPRRPRPSPRPAREMRLEPTDEAVG
jgi:PASTA domain